LRFKFCLNFKERRNGFGIVELLIVIGIIGIALAGMASFGNYALQINSRIKHQVAAVYLAEEAIEAANIIKEENWSLLAALNPGNPYHPVINSGRWVLAAGIETINNYNRKVILENVFRDTEDNIVTSGGVIDPGSRKITSTVYWYDQGHDYEVKLVSYLTDWQP
jgi:prepilin-type N-terminal cleavage/methylation domain-containing protein